MKKIISTVLCIFMLVTALSFATFAAEDASFVKPVGVKCADSKPVSFEEVWEYNVDGWPFFLAYSDISYGFEVLLSDGTSLFDKVEKPASSDEVSGDGGTTRSGEAVQKKLSVFCEPYVIKQDCLDAMAQGKKTVPLYVIVHFSYYDAQDKFHSEEYRFTAEKEIAPHFAEIVSVSGMPEYINEGSYRTDLSNAVFEIKYWDGSVRQEKAKDVSYGKTQSEYILAGEALRYNINEKDKQIKISFCDSGYTHSVSEVRECPFSAVKITDCKFEGDCLKEISYELTKKDGTVSACTKEIENPYPDVERTVDFVEGYEVSVEAYSQKNRSGVKINITNDISDENVFPHETDNIFKNIIARIYVFFLRLYMRITGKAL